MADIQQAVSFVPWANLIYNWTPLLIIAVPIVGALLVKYVLLACCECMMVALCRALCLCGCGGGRKDDYDFGSSGGGLRRYSSSDDNDERCNIPFPVIAIGCTLATGITLVALIYIAAAPYLH